MVVDHFPEGIPIGTVSDFEIEEVGDYYRIQVKLLTDMTSLKHVYLVQRVDAPGNKGIGKAKRCGITKSSKIQSVSSCWYWSKYCCWIKSFFGIHQSLPLPLFIIIYPYGETKAYWYCLVFIGLEYWHVQRLGRHPCGSLGIYCLDTAFRIEIFFWRKLRIQQRCGSIGFTITTDGLCIEYGILCTTLCYFPRNFNMSHILLF